VNAARLYGNTLVAERLKAARKAAGFSSARAAAAIHGWPESTYRSHEAGVRAIPNSDLAKYAAAFNIPADDLRSEDIPYGGSFGEPAFYSPVPDIHANLKANRGSNAKRKYRSPNHQLISARLAAGFKTAAAAADRYGWRRSTYFAHENGQNQVTKDIAELYGYAFGVDPAWILGREDADKPSSTQARHPDEVRQWQEALEHRQRVSRESGLDPRLQFLPEFPTTTLALANTETTIKWSQRTAGRSWGIPTDYLDEVINADPGSLVFAALNLPDTRLGLQPGDRVLIDTSDRDLGTSEPFARVDPDGLLAVVWPTGGSEPASISGVVGRIVAFIARPQHA
jgi:transcriptional regulator with XRE-family HTH domain